MSLACKGALICRKLLGQRRLGGGREHGPAGERDRARASLMTHNGTAARSCVGQALIGRLLVLGNFLGQQGQQHFVPILVTPGIATLSAIKCR
jgi:hypothetical protein